jgi:hypothetical protein
MNFQSLLVTTAAQQKYNEKRSNKEQMSKSKKSQRNKRAYRLKRKRQNDKERISKKRQKIENASKDGLLMIDLHDLKDEDIKVDVHDCGYMDCVCAHCRSLNFHGEALLSSTADSYKFNICCERGKITFPQLKSMDPIMRYLYTSNDAKAQAYRDNIHQLNNSLTLASTKLHRQKYGHFEQCSYRIQGKILHYIGPMYPQDNDQSYKFLQLYIHDPSHEIQNRLEFHQNLQNNQTIASLIELLQNHLRNVNPYIQHLQQAMDKLKRGETKELKLVIHAVKDPGTHHKKQYAKPTNEISCIIPNYEDGAKNIARHDIVIQSHKGGLSVLEDDHRSHDPLIYVLLFPKGDEGHHKSIYPRPKAKMKNTPAKFFRHRVMIRQSSKATTFQLENNFTFNASDYGLTEINELRPLLNDPNFQPQNQCILQLQNSFISVNP